jgi:hypothetical protein
MRLAFALAVSLTASLPLAGQGAPAAVDALHRPYDELLDLYVRDGFVYYAALKSDRGRLDRYIAALDGPEAAAHANGSPAKRRALWINAYNALVLRTVINSYPIRGKASQYPANSIRQIPGAFERTTHRVAGRAVTLDAIEKEILVPLGDARVFLALGRGSVGGGRLRSEAYDDSRLEQQLSAVAAETLTRKEVVRIDIGDNQLAISPLFSWREAAFVASLADKADKVFAGRSPLERAVLALIEPHLVGAEADFLEKNGFRVTFSEFDWRLNDLNARP